MRMRDNDVKSEKYQGLNEIINDYIVGETWWIVNGPIGRVPIQADTELEAREIYKSRRDKFNTDDVE